MLLFPCDEHLCRAPRHHGPILAFGKGLAEQRPSQCVCPCPLDTRERHSRSHRLPASRRLLWTIPLHICLSDCMHGVEENSLGPESPYNVIENIVVEATMALVRFTFCHATQAKATAFILLGVCGVDVVL